MPSRQSSRRCPRWAFRSPTSCPSRASWWPAPTTSLSSLSPPSASSPRTCCTRPRRCSTATPLRLPRRRAPLPSKAASLSRPLQRVTRTTAPCGGPIRGRRAAHCSVLLAQGRVLGGEMTVTDAWDAQMKALGSFIRSQRKLANLSLRQLADLTSLSNPYLSQIERGLHQPSVRVLRLLADALNVSAETLLAEAGLLEHGADAARGEAESGTGAVESVIRADAKLDDEQKAALLAVYRSMLKGQ